MGDLWEFSVKIWGKYGKFRVASVFRSWNSRLFPGFWEHFSHFSRFSKDFSRSFQLFTRQQHTWSPPLTGQNSRKNRPFSICVYFSHFRKLLLKIISMVGGNFENFLPEVTKMHLKHPPWLEIILKTTYMEWLKCT